MVRGLVRLGLAAVVVAVFSATPVFAGNIGLTGHDDDFHCSGGLAGGGNPPCAQLGALISFARAGSSNPSLPVLTFDQGSELTSFLTANGIPFTNISAPGSVTAALFNPATFSAFAEASDSTCGGCDNTPAMESAINAQAAAIAAFFNAGGGIVGLAGATNAGTYYNFVPSTASGFGSPPSSGYVQTACGAAAGIPAVNGNATHNFFTGFSPAYCVAETLGVGGTSETLVLAGGAIVTSVITTGGGPGPGVPGPATLTMLVLGVCGAAWWERRRRS